MAQDTLQAARERFQDATDAFREQRARMVEDMHFSNPANPQQWDQRARAIRENGPDGARPCLTLDHTNQYIAQVVNDARQNKPAIKFIPASGGSRQEVAEALTGIASHIEYQSRAQIAYDTAQEHAARVGLGWFGFVPELVNPALNYQEIRVRRFHDTLSVVCDPDWCEPDGADIVYGFVATSMSTKAFKAKYPKAKPETWGKEQRATGWTADHSLRVCEYFDKTETKRNQLIIQLPDGTKKVLGEDEYWDEAQKLGFQPLVIQQYTGTESKVMWRTMSGAEVLEETEFPSQYVPLVPVIGYEVWIEGKRYLAGMVRRMMEAQRAYNYERSAWVETVALQPKAPYLAAAEATEGHEAEWGRANKSNLAYLTWNAYDQDGKQLPMPKREQPPAIPAAFAQGAQFAQGDIEASVGMYRASLGAPSNETSGRAINARDRQGETANFHYTDNLSRSIERGGRIMLDMIVRLYDEPREARILGQDGTAKPVKIDPRGDAYAVDGDIASINPTTGTYDARVKAGPSFTTLRQEASEGLNQMMTGNPAFAAVVGPIWARMQDWPEADKLSKALLAMAPPQVQQALSEGQEQDSIDGLKKQLMQVEQQAQQMHQALDMAAEKIKEYQSKETKTRMEYLAKAAQLENDMYAKVTDRIKAMRTGMTPEQVQALVIQVLQQAQEQHPEGGEELEQVVEYGSDVEGMPEPPGEMEAEQQGPSGPFSLPDESTAPA